MENENTLPILTAPELRVLGALMEKSRSTPEYYPMTLNALTAACNQKTSRNPVTDFDEETVSAALSSLKGRSLVATAVGGGSRVLKYKHNFGTVFDVSDAELVVLCLLFLRGAQTPGELNTNSGRLYEFKDLNEVLLTLDKLQSASPAFVAELPKRAGQKETRFIHLLGGNISEDTAPSSNEQPKSNKGAIEERLSVVEQELAVLKAQMEKLLGDLS